MLNEQLAAAGFDIAQPFDAAACAREPGLAMLDDPARRLGWLVANTRALWPRFLAARDADPNLAASPHPLDLYVETTLDTIAASIPGARVYYGHKRYDHVFLPLQRLAVAVGLGALAPTQLVIHPIYGPWWSLRAVILCDGEPVQAPKPPSACECKANCHQALAAALVATGPDRQRAWLAVRDACPVGREHRYTDDQIAYHYGFLR